MTSASIVDAASRMGAMAEGKKPKKWIAKATANAHGQFRRKAEHAGETTRAFAETHRGDSDKTGKQARLALALMGDGRASHSLYRKKG